MDKSAIVSVRGAITTGLCALFLVGILSQYQLIYLNLRGADALAGGWQDYDPVVFADHIDSGAPLLVEVYASWCPTCLLQHRALKTIAATGPALPVPAMRVDFDRDQDFIQRFHIQGTGFMMLFARGMEVDREAGLVTPEDIRNFLHRNGYSSGQI